MVLGEKKTKIITAFTFIPAVFMIISIPVKYNFSLIFLILTVFFVLLPVVLSFFYFYCNKYSRSSATLRIAMVFQVILLILIILKERI